MQFRFKSGSRFEVKCSLIPLAFMWHYHYAKPIKVERRYYTITSYGVGWSIRLHKPIKRHRLPEGPIHWSSRIQNWLQGIGISTCNQFRQECTQDFQCCSWAVSEESKRILEGLAGSSVASAEAGGYVIVKSEGFCVFCGKLADLRMRTCFECAKNVSVEEPVEGVTVLKHTKTNKVAIV